MLIGILVTGHALDELRDTRGDYDKIFDDLLTAFGFETKAWFVVDEAYPTSPAEADGWLITGSKHGAYEDHPWIPPLEDFIRDVYADGRPMVGICFGHQIIAQALGGKVVRAGKPMHGKVSTVTVKPDPLFQGMPESFEATRYHSLTVDQASLPGGVEVLATADDDGEIMALKVRSSMTYGVQFHPESFASPTGGQILGNFLTLAGQRANA